MHRLLRQIRIALCLAACCVLLPMLILSAKAIGTVDELPDEPVVKYGITVGGVPVTEKNCADIFGNGQAVFSPENDLLTIRGGEIGGAPVQAGEENAGMYSLWSARENLQVVLEGNIRFSYGIYLTSGNITIRSASLTFLGLSGGGTYITLDKGALSVTVGSVVQGNGLTGVTGACFTAENILIEDSTVSLSDGGAVQRTIGACISAKSSLKILNSRVSYNAFYTACETFLYAGGMVQIKDSGVSYNALTTECETFLHAGGSLQIANGDIDARNVRVFILVDQGKTSVSDNSKVVCSRCYHGMKLWGDVELRDSVFNITSYYSGILLNPFGDTAFRSQSCNLTLVSPSFEELQRDVLIPDWEKRSEELSERYGSRAAYLSECYRDYQRAVETVDHSGFYANNSDMEFSSGHLYVSGYLAGIFFRSRGRTLSFQDGCTLTFKDCRGAAFIALTDSTEAVSFGSRVTGNAVSVILPAEEVLGDYGKYVVTLTDPNTTLTVRDPAKIGTPQKVLEAYSGFAGSVEITVDEFHISSIAWPLVILLLASGAAAIVYFAFRRFWGKSREANTAHPSGGDGEPKGGASDES